VKVCFFSPGTLTKSFTMKREEIVTADAGAVYSSVVSGPFFASSTAIPPA